MGLMDDMKDKGQDMMNDPDAHEEIQRIAEERNISFDEAKRHYLETRGEDSM